MKPTQLWKLMKKSIRRRKKETRKVVLISFLACFFLSGILVYQDNMNSYLKEKNKTVYGDWLFMTKSEAEELEKYPYIDGTSRAYVAGSIYLDGGKENSNFSVGYLDEKLREKGHIRLYEGEFPTQSDEIAMELNVLSRLGYSYDLGQKITLNVKEDEESERLVKKEYTLVGTLKSFTGFWINGNLLPSALVSKQGYQEFGMKGTCLTYYHLRSGYESDDFSSVPNEIYQSMKIQVFYNSLLYGSNVWGSEILYRTILIIVMIAAMAALVYILNSYLGPRKREYFKLRGIGADKLQIRHIIFAECGLTCSIGAAFGILSAYVLAGIIMSGISLYQHLGTTYHIKLITFLMIILVTAITILASIGIAQISCRSGALYEGSKAVSQKKRNRMRRIPFKGKRCDRAILRRQNCVHRSSMVFSRGFNILICGILIFCAINISLKNYRYELWKDEIDYRIDYPDNVFHEYRYTPKGSTEEHIWCTTFSSFYSGQEQEAEEVQELLGVQKVMRSTVDTTHIFNWENKEYNNFGMRIFSEKNGVDVSLLPKDDPMYGYAIYIYEDTKYAYEQLRKINPNLKLSYRAFAEGSQVVLGYSEEGSSLCANGFPDKDFLASKTVQVETKSKPVTALSAGAINVSTQMRLRLYEDCNYCIIASPAFAEKIAQMDGQKLHYNCLEIYLNALADFEGTQKVLANYAANNGASTSSNIEFKQSTIDDLYQAIFFYGIFAMISLLLYIIIKTNMIQTKLRYQMKTFARLKSIGMSNRFFLKMQLKDALYEGFFCILSVIPVFFGIYISDLRELSVIGEKPNISFYLSPAYLGCVPFIICGMILLILAVSYVMNRRQIAQFGRDERRRNG